MVRAAALAISVVSFVVSPSITVADDRPPLHDTAGTLHIHGDLTIPPSDFWSSAFRDEYAKGVIEERKTKTPPADPHPPRDAPRAAWDKFDAWINGQLAAPLARALERYPVDVVDTSIAGVHVGIITPKGGVSPENQGRVLINLHGGGFVDFRGLGFGELESVPVSSMGKIKVVTVDYRQSPYYKYPAASEDVEAVYRDILKKYKPDAIGICGCSAGGFLRAQAVAWMQAKGLPRPGAIGIFCAALPGVSFPFGKSGDSKMWGLGIIPESPDQRAVSPLSSAASWYMEGADIHDPKAYPAISDSVLAKFPPVLILSGTRELTMSPAVVSHARLLKLGVDSSLYIMEGGWHAAHATAVDTPEAHDANAYIALVSAASRPIAEHEELLRLNHYDGYVRVLGRSLDGILQGDMLGVLRPIKNE
jgi:acetyl esterase/lipase